VDQVQPGADPDRASNYRVYDCLLGGTDNLPVDRVLSARVLGAAPEAPRMVLANRAFLLRAVRFLAAEAGIGRFLDIGSGLSARGNVHEVALEAGCQARVLYVDNDPDVVARSRALLAERGRAAVIQADLRRPRELLGRPEVQGLLAPGEPVALTLFGVLHLIDDAGLGSIVAALRAALPPGSYLAISHLRNISASHPVDAAQIETGLRALGDLLGIVSGRDQEEILGYFGDFELLDPGLVPLPEWRPSPHSPRRQYAGHHAWVGGIARKR